MNYIFRYGSLRRAKIQENIVCVYFSCTTPIDKQLTSCTHDNSSVSNSNHCLRGSATYF